MPLPRLALLLLTGGAGLAGSVLGWSGLEWSGLSGTGALAQGSAPPSLGDARGAATPGPEAGAEASAALVAGAEARAGQTIEIDWTLLGRTAQPQDLIVLARPGASATDYLARSYPRANPVVLRLALEPGQWELRYLAVDLAGAAQILGALPIRILPVQVQLDVPARIGAGNRFLALHDGPAYGADYIAFAPPGSGADAYVTYNYVARGGPVPLVAPLAAGAYELRYIAYDSRGERILGSVPIEVTPARTVLRAAQTAPAGSVLTIDWEGPLNPRDFLAIARPGEPAEEYDRYLLTSAGSPLEFQLPVEPGDWELRYIATGEDYATLASLPLTLLPVEASLWAPESGLQGAPLPVGFAGPLYPGDHLTIALPGSPADESLTYVFANPDGEAGIALPLRPGRYELRYVTDNDPDVVLAAQPIQVLPASAALEAASLAGAGGRLALRWAGPDNPGDLVTLARAGTPADQSLAHAWTADGEILTLQLPHQPGEYELRYVAAGSPAEVLASRALTVTGASALLEAPDEAHIGAEILVTWQGPANSRDRIVLVDLHDPDPDTNSEFGSASLPGADPGEAIAGQVLSRALLQTGQPARLSLPVQPGAYELRYLAGGGGGAVLARRPISVFDVPASLEAPAEGPAGAEITLSWQGPGNFGDQVVITALPPPGGEAGGPQEAGPGRDPGQAGTNGGQQAGSDILSPGHAPPAPAGRGDDAEVLGHAWTRDGNVLRLRLPTRPGLYQLHYLARGASADRILASLPIRVSEVAASLTAPAEAAAGSALALTWQGPNHAGDRIELVRPGAPEASPVAVLFPDMLAPPPMPAPLEPGSYELRYILRGQPERILARQALRVTPADVALEAPAQAPAGTAIMVGWQGPGATGDHLALFEDSAESPARADLRPGGGADPAPFPAEGSVPVATGHLVRGNPLRLTLPPQPGAYVLRYISGQDGRILAEQSLALE